SAHSGLTQSALRLARMLAGSRVTAAPRSSGTMATGTAAQVLRGTRIGCAVYIRSVLPTTGRTRDRSWRTLAAPRSHGAHFQEEAAVSRSRAAARLPGAPRPHRRLADPVRDPEP